jgi:hypothetical protein
MSTESDLVPRGCNQEQRLVSWSVAGFLQYAREQRDSIKPEHKFARHMWDARVDTTATLLEHIELGTHRMVDRV